MDVKEIKKIMELIQANDVSEFELEEDAYRLVIKRGSTAAAQPVMYHSAPMQAPLPAGVPAAGAPAPTAQPDADAGLIDIKSPIVGTFYRASSPDADMLAKVGDRVEENTVVCIIEAMKVMNEIKAECKGVIRKILVDNATPVEFGQVLFKVEP